MLSNGSTEDVLGVGTYKLRLYGENTLYLYDTLHAPRVQVCLFSLVSLMKLSFSFSSSTKGLNIMYVDNVCGHTTLKNNFLVLDIDDCCNNNETSFALSHIMILFLILLNGMLDLVVLAKIE